MKNLVKSRFHSFQQPIVIVIAVAVLVWMSGCKTATSPSTTGSFAGRVLLFDSTGTALADFSGTTVSIDGTMFNTTTDSIGQWTINGVPEGQYNITATKPSLGTFHWYEQQLLGGRLDLQAAGIANMSSHTPVLSFAQYYGGSLGFTALPNNDSGQYLAGYCDIDSTTQPSDPHLATTEYDLDGAFSYDVLRAAGVRSGQTLYISVSNVFNNSNIYAGCAVYYFDPVHNETRYASTGPKSNVIAVTMP